jgi:hypothetical protein
VVLANGLNIHIGVVQYRIKAICLQSSVTFVQLIFMIRYVLDASGFDIYIFVCFDVFSKFVKLYPLKAATNKACLKKIVIIMW